MLPIIVDNTEATTQSDRVFHLLELEIVAGRLPMGSRLGEEALASRFGVSRGPLREALRRLEGRALVVHTAHSGVRVTSLSSRDVVELYQIRENLEGLAARLAAQNMSEQRLDDLRKLLDQQAASIEPAGDISYPQGVKEQDFHYCIATGCGSTRLQKLLCEDLYSLIRLCRFKTWSIPGRRKAHRDHQRIVEVLYERDGDLAEALMRRHVATARERVLTAGADRDESESIEDVQGSSAGLTVHD